MSGTPNAADVLAKAGVDNKYIVEFVEKWAKHLEPDTIEVISAADNDRLIKGALEAGELLPAGKDLYYSRSYSKDTARNESCTVVATHSEADKGVYNNWHDAETIKASQMKKMKGAYKGKTMYVLPYIMSPKDSPFAKWAAGVEITDNRSVCLQMIRMARVGYDYLKDLEDPSHFEHSIHVTGDLEHLGQGTPNDQRCFATVADDRTILHFGSSYGGNALLGKIAHGLRQASFDGWRSGDFLAEQFMLIGIENKKTGEKRYVCGGFPSASGKTNLAMTLAPKGLEDYNVYFYGDDIVWMRIGKDGRLYGMNPEYGAFGVAPDTNEHTNPTAIESIKPGSGAIFTNVAYNEKKHEVWWEGLTPDYPEDVDGWLDWKGEKIADRPVEHQKSGKKEDAWAHPNSRFTTSLKNVPNVAPDYERPDGVPIDAIIFGGRVRDREPLIRAFRDPAEGVYDGLTLGAEATYAAEDAAGKLRYDPMSMRPFLSYPEGKYAEHWLEVLAKVKEKGGEKALPIFAHVNWFQKGEDGHYMWPGYRDNLRALLWMLDFKDGKVKGTKTPVGYVPKVEELDLTGFEGSRDDLKKLLVINHNRWMQEMESREKHLNQFRDLPKAIWDAHNRIKKEIAEQK